MSGFAYHIAFIVVMIIEMLKWYNENENIYEIDCLFLLNYN
jgi:hypothetical protein